MEPWPVLYLNIQNNDYNIYTLQYLLRVAVSGRWKNLHADGSFGSKTESAVKEFQQSVGIHSDGKVGEETWKKMVIEGKAIKCYPKEGDGRDKPSDCVKAAQAQLIKSDYLHGGVKAMDGIFLTNTNDALTRFQEEKMPPPHSHKVDNNTWEHLIRNGNPG